jgi:hypothetical protein
LDYKNCINWCETIFDSCKDCNSYNDGVIWLQDKSISAESDCVERWSGCNDDSDCCTSTSSNDNIMTCQLRSEYYYVACLPSSSSTGDDNDDNNNDNNNDPTPTKAPVNSNSSPITTVSQLVATPITTLTPAPVLNSRPTTIPFNVELLSTSKAMNAWDAFKGLEYITNFNTTTTGAPNFAVVVS